MPFITQGKTNWKFLLIVVILAAIVGGGILWCVRKQEIPTSEFLKTKKTEESITAEEIILSDEEIVEILKEFAAKITARFRDAEVDKILLDALEFKNTDTRDRLHNLIGKFEELSETIEDAPDLRSWKVQRTKLCIAESIISDDLENTTQRCGYEAEFSFTGADDLLADTQIISFFINGFAHYYKEDYPKADYYFDQIKLHYSFLESFEVDFSAEHLELYNKIYNKVLEISSGVVKDETADCLKKYSVVVFEDCVPGEVVDGWWGTILYPNTLDASNIEHYIDAPAPDIVKQAGIARYGASQSTCQTTYFIKINGEWKKVGQIEFCNYIIDYNSSCNDCLLEWEEGCC